MAGIQQTSQRRSDLLDQLLRKGEDRPRNIQSSAQLVAELGTAFVNKKTADRLKKAEAEAQQQIVNALNGRDPDSKVELEGVDGAPSEQINIPGRRRTTRDLTLEQRATAQGIQANEASIDASRAAAEKSRLPVDSRTSGQKEFDRFRKNNPNSPIDTFVKFKKATRAGTTINNNIPQNNPAGFNANTAIDKEITRQRATKSMVFALGDSLNNVRDHPRSTGLVGAGADVANRAGDVPVFGSVIEGITTQITGLEPDELSEIRTQAAGMVARLVPIVTGDISGRYTDKEQERTLQVQQQSLAWRSGKQVRGGLGELQAMTIRGELVINGAFGIETIAGRPIDITTAVGAEEWGALLETQFGLSPTKALKEFDKHLRLVQLTPNARQSMIRQNQINAQLRNPEAFEAQQ